VCWERMFKHTFAQVRALTAQVRGVFQQVRGSRLQVRGVWQDVGREQHLDRRTTLCGYRQHHHHYLARRHPSTRCPSPSEGLF